MNTPSATSLTSASRGAGSGTATNWAGSSKGCLLIVTVTAVAAGASLAFALTDGTNPLLSAPSPVTNPGVYYLAYGAGLAPPAPPLAEAGVTQGTTAHTKAQLGSNGSGGVHSKTSVTAPTNYGASYTVAGGNVTFKVEYAQP